MSERPHRPARFADLTEMIDAAGGDASPSARAETASATAHAVVSLGRTAARADDSDSAAAPAEASAETFVALADEVGLDTLAELWRGSDPASLPGVLWTLYLLRQWCRADAEQVRRLWRAGEPLAPADAAVAGLADFPDAPAVHRFADAVVAGLYRGDLDVALERAAAFFRVVAAGRRAVDAATTAYLAERNEQAAADLSAAAEQWRRGRLH